PFTSAPNPPTPARPAIPAASGPSLPTSPVIPPTKPPKVLPAVPRPLVSADESALMYAARFPTLTAIREHPRSLPLPCLRGGPDLVVRHPGLTRSRKELFELHPL